MTVHSLLQTIAEGWWFDPGTVRSNTEQNWN